MERRGCWRLSESHQQPFFSRRFGIAFFKVFFVNTLKFPPLVNLDFFSEPQGISFIETANLDGETNLKIRQAAQTTITLTTNSEFCGLKGTLECEAPNRHLYEFNGVLKVQDTTYV